MLGEVRDRGAALRELYAVLRPGGVLPITEIFGAPDYRRPATGRGFQARETLHSFPAYALNFESPRVLTAEQPSPESVALR